LVRNGVSQVFFVIDGRFDPYETATYNLLRTIIFDSEITNHTTITRSRFEEFRSEEKCKKDINLMIKNDGELKEIIESCQRRVIHVDNPSKNILAADNENEEEKQVRGKK